MLGAYKKREGGDLEALLAATILHDCVAVEKTLHYERKHQLFLQKKPPLFWNYGLVDVED